MKKGTIAQVSVSPGGMPKRAIPEGRVTRDGLAGDWQKNRKYHGGPDRAVCLFSTELYAELAAEGVAAAPGDFGENLTTAGIDLNRLNVGDRLRAGQTLLEITTVRVPCNQLKVWDKRMPKLIKGRSGWLARVIEEGTVRPGDTAEVLPNQQGGSTEQHQTAPNVKLPENGTPCPTPTKSPRTTKAPSPSSAPARTT